MARGKTICNKCGKTFNEWDESNNFGIHQTLGYGSKHDGSEIDLDLCCECADELVGHLVTICQVNPIMELK